MTTGLMNRGMLNPKQCWKDWSIHLGTLQAVRDKLKEEGNVNPKTGEPPTISAIEKAAYRWAIYNQEEARRDLEYAWSKEGVIVTDGKWLDFIEKASGLVFYQRPKKLARFDAQNGIQRS